MNIFNANTVSETENEIFLDSSCNICLACVNRCPAAREKIRTPQEIVRFGCISCGNCVNICPENAISYRDDTVSFVEALKRGEKITVLVAPAVERHFDSYEKLFGFLKFLGARSIHRVILYADIAIWAYTKILKQNPSCGFIASPCASITRYIRYHRPKLLNSVMPVYSPMQCAAVYLRKYAGLEGELAFISPCIAKRAEMRSIGSSMISYNITIGKLKKYLKDNCIDIDRYSPEGYDDRRTGDGATLELYGGLSESIIPHVPKMRYVKISGAAKAYDFLASYENLLHNDDRIPNLAEVYNCEDPCDGGPGCGQNGTRYKSQQKAGSAREKFFKPEDSMLYAKEVFSEFDRELDLEDFKAIY